MSAEARVRDPIERIGSFLAREGLPWQRLVLDALLGEEAPSALRAHLGEAQREDGAIALPGVADPIASTLRALEFLIGLRQRDVPEVERATAFLVRGQAEDGGFLEDERDASLRLTGSARIAGHLAMTTCVRHSVLLRATDYLERCWRVELAQNGALEPLTGYFHTLTHFPTDLVDECLQWCGRELERGYRLDTFAPLDVARVFSLCEALALPGARLGAGEVLVAVLDQQQPDGGFAAEGAATRADRSVTAALVLARLAPSLEAAEDEGGACSI